MTPAERVAELMRRLDTLTGGAEAAARLVACGAAARGPLREYLLRGRPSGVFQPRTWAVQALAGLGADDVLVEYLSTPPVDDPVARLGEAAVRDTAARLLADSRHPDATAVLLQAARRECLPGALEAAARRDPDAALLALVAALEEDFARDSATIALRAIGPRAADVLIAAALDPGNDSEGARRRRRAALDVLDDVRPDQGTWRRVAPLLADDDIGIVCGVCRLGLHASAEPSAIARRLVALLPRIGWDWMATVEEMIAIAVTRAGPTIALRPPAEVLDGRRPDLAMAWRRIARRIAALREERAG